MANVLFLTLVFPPDSVSTAHIMGDLAEELKALGHSVTVLTTVPHFNRDTEAEARQPVHHFWNFILQKSDFNNIPVYHVFMPRKPKIIPLRLLAWLAFHVLSLIAGMIIIPRADIIIAPSPPLTIGLCAWLLSLRQGSGYIYNVQELYPDVVIDLGLLRNRWLIGLLRWLERLVYSKARFITVIAPGMRERLLKKGVSPDKVRCIPNFADIEQLRPLPKDNPFSRHHNMQNKYVVSYAGNLGYAQDLVSLIRSADQLRTMSDICFWIVGDGVLEKYLRQQVQALKLNNCLFLPYQPYSLMAQIYGASDLCVVPIECEIGLDAIPSKVYRIMACARPVLAVADPSSDLARLVKAVGCGVVVPPRSPESLAAAILSAYENQKEWAQKGQQGRGHVLTHYTRSGVGAQYHELIRIAADHKYEESI